MYNQLDEIKTTYDLKEIEVLKNEKNEIKSFIHGYSLFLDNSIN